jgi:uncharacterized heparinase superfamily protein
MTVTPSDSAAGKVDAASEPACEPDLFAEPPAGTDGDRVRRGAGAAGTDQGLSLTERITAGLHRLSYRTALHRIRLRGHFPLKLLAVPADPLPGDVAVGARIAAGRLPHAGYNAPSTQRFADPAAPVAWRDWAHGFAWLRDLAVVADRTHGATIAQPIVARWLTDHAEFDAVAWAPDLIARRLIFWTTYAPYILSSPDLVYRSTVLNTLARMARHLDRVVEKLPDGMQRVTAAAGLTVAALLIPGVDARLVRAEGLLDRALTAIVAGDGGVTDRAPATQLALLELLLQVSAAHTARGRSASEGVVAAIDRLVPALASLALGDGAIGAWHGPGVAATRLAAAFAASGRVARPSRAAGVGGYQRAAGGTTLIVVDAAPPPQARAATAAHAGSLAFELSSGTQRLVVTCGAPGVLPLPAALATGLRTTAAHSTLILADSNSTRIRPDGALGRGVEEVVVGRHESEDGIWLDFVHDGYAARFGVRHRRRLFLAANGSDLRGEDNLEPVAGARLRRRGARATFDVRFHLGAGVAATPTADGQGALVKLASGSMWQVRARGGPLAIDDSVWVGPDGTPVPTKQLVVSAMTSATGAGSVTWSFTRMGK